MEKLRIGFLNLMPNAKDYVALVRRSLASVQDGIALYPIRLKSREYRSDNEDGEPYFHFRELVEQGSIDLLIVTGAPVERMPYDEIPYWPELRDVFALAQQRAIPVMGICFGGLAIGKYLGIEKRILEEKLYGVYRVPAAFDSARYFGADSSSINLAMSTWALLDEATIDDALRARLKSIARHPSLGELMLATADDQFVMILGHPEYTVDVLHKEWLRDMAKDMNYARQIDESDFIEMERLLVDGSRPIIANWIRSHKLKQRVAS